jgi:Uncharacterized protein conserved in bacteria (DUF2252)
MGRDLRRQVPRRSLGDWVVRVDRPDPVQLIIESHRGRLQWLIPVRGWTTVGGHQYYVRQFRNMKGSVTLDSIDGAALADYAAITGHLLAKGHPRTSGASMIVGYAGSSDRLDVALARFARLYADQTEADHAA